MVRSASADELLRRARHAAGTRNVRESIRDLTLHALKGRLLTAAHVAAVVRTVGEGIESSAAPASESTRETHRGAWAGLEDAVARALRAMELAAREVAEGRAQIASAEREELIAEIGALRRSLGESWAHPRVTPATFDARIASMAALLSRAATVPDGASAAGASPSLACLASGVLLGLSEESHDPTRGTRGNGSAQSPARAS
jgi:hypothetical protein